MFVSLGRRVSTSMAMARNVLTSETASAPASSAARANEATSVTFGVSFGITGSVVTLRTALTTSCVPVRLQPNVMPPSLMFGQEMFSSMAATPSASERIRASSTYSSIVVPQMLTNTTARRSRSSGSRSRMKRWTPMPCRPMALSIPAGRFDNARRRMALARGEEQAFDRDAAERREIDDVGVLDAVAEAAAGGDQWVGEAQRADAKPESHSPCQCGRGAARPDAIPSRSIRRVEHRTIEARSDEVRALAGVRRQDDAAVAAAEAAAHDLFERDRAGSPVLLGQPSRRRASSASVRTRTTGSASPGVQRRERVAERSR